MSKSGQEARQNTLVQVFMSEEERAAFNEFRANTPELRQTGRVMGQDGGSSASMADLAEVAARYIMQVAKSEGAQAWNRVIWRGMIRGRILGGFVGFGKGCRERDAESLGRQIAARAREIQAEFDAKFNNTVEFKELELLRG